MIARPVLSVGRRVRLRHVRDAVEPLLSPGKRVLDAGCSDGRLAADLAAAHQDCEVVAMDLDENALVLARDRAKRLGNMRVERAVMGAGQPPQKFDVVVCADVLEHIADDDSALAWLAQSLQSNGDLMLHVPADPQQHALRGPREAMTTELAAGKGPHVRLGYSPERLRELTAAARLSVVDWAWTFHHPVTQLAADLDTWTYQRRARPVKLALLPFLLGAGALERAPSRTRPGNGLLLHARASS